MDPLLGLGVGSMLLGTGMNLYGTHQRDKATRRALKDYQNAIAQRTAQERAALMEEQGALSGLAQERQRGIGTYLNELQMGQFPGTDEGFRERNTGALTDIKELTKGSDGTYAYAGAPRFESERMQAGQTAGTNSRLAEALLADQELRQIDEREKAAGHRMAFGELMRSNKGASMQQRFALAKALRDLDWQRKTAAMQGALDEAGRKGQWMNILGGLGTQAGGMMTMAGLMGAGGATGAGGTGATAGMPLAPGAAGPVGIPNPGATSIYNFTAP